ncbi:Uncharacterised protein [Vibrio cholerae]|nr:Uncharacterised protein [Vibrio cholerae]
MVVDWADIIRGGHNLQRSHILHRLIVGKIVHIDFRIDDRQCTRELCRLKKHHGGRISC